MQRPTPDTSSSSPPEQVPALAPVALHSLASALGQKAFDKRAAAFLTELSSGLGCARVTLGFLERGAIRIKAVSHGSAPHTGGELFRDIGDAMEEAIDQQRILRVPADDDGAPAIVRAGLRLRARLGGTVQTVPIGVDGEPVGALCFEWDSTATVIPAAPAPLGHLVDLTGPVLFLMYRDACPGAVRIRESIGAAWRGLRGEQGKWPRRALLLLAAAMLAGTALPVPQTVSARAHLEGRIERAVVAPIDGFIDRVHVRPGDRVEAGQLVIDLSAQDLELEAQRWETERSQHESAYMAALARSARSDMMVSLSRAEEAKARLSLARNKLARMNLAAGIDGIVIDGDLGRLEGAPVARGDVLLTLAPADGHRVVLEVDERDIARLERGLPGSLLLSALPDRALPIEIARITPMAGVVDGNNVYRVEARLLVDEPALRPGLRGMARIRTAHAPLIGSLWQRASAHLRVAWWRWGG